MEEVRRFPVGSPHHRGVYLPWAMIKPYEDQALRNHGQTLERLAERGGLSPREALCILDREGWMQSSWSRKHEEEAVLELEKRVRVYERMQWEGEVAKVRKSLDIWKEKALTAQGKAAVEQGRREKAERLLQQVLGRPTDDLKKEIQEFLDGPS